MLRFVPLLAALALAACPSIGASRALDEASAALETATPASLETASTHARFDWFAARAYLEEARMRAGHGDWQQAESWAVKARKAAEAALRRVVGDTP